MRWWGQKINVFVIAIILLQISSRMAMPVVLEYYVKRVLNTLPGYKAELKSVSIHLLTISYQIDSLKIYKLSRHGEKPLLEAPVVKVSLDWQAVLNGRIASKIYFERPVLNITVDAPPNLYSIQSWIRGIHWRHRIQKLLMLKVNQVSVKDGELNFYDHMPERPVHLFLRSVQLQAVNLTHAIGRDDLLPAKIFMHSIATGEGTLSVSASINAQKVWPDLDVDVKLEHVNLKALRHFFSIYTQADVQQGDFNVYSEIGVLDGKIHGYVMPQFNSLQTENTVLIKNPAGNDRLSARLPVTGRVPSLQAMYWPGLWQVFSKSFTEACRKSSEETITFQRKRRTRLEKVWIYREHRLTDRD
jgi:hypothetical protein